MEQYKISFWEKLVMMWKYEIRYYPKQIIIGIKNLYKWTPVIWKDRDWDDTFLFEIIKFKISKMSENHCKVMPYEGCERNVEVMNTIVRLIEKFQTEEYLHEYFTYVDYEHTFEKVNGTEYYQMKTKNTRDELDLYFEKYPVLKRRAVNHKIYKNNPSSINLAISMGFVKHEQTKRLIFELLNRHVDKWWE